MTILRRTLKLQAAIWFGLGIGLLVAPRFVVRSVLSQPRVGDVAWLRLSAVQAIALALLMVLVANRLQDLWWWSWAFAVLEAGTATICAVHALVGVPAGAPVWPWWLLAFGSVAFAILLLLGLASAAQEKPFV